MKSRLWLFSRPIRAYNMYMYVQMGLENSGHLMGWKFCMVSSQPLVRLVIKKSQGVFFKLIRAYLHVHVIMQQPPDWSMVSGQWTYYPLDFFGDCTLDSFFGWIQSWHMNEYWLQCSDNNLKHLFHMCEVYYKDSQNLIDPVTNYCMYRLWWLHRGDICFVRKQQCLVRTHTHTHTCSLTHTHILLFTLSTLFRIFQKR